MQEYRPGLISGGPAVRHGKVFIHAEPAWHDSIAAGRFDFFARLRRRVETEGMVAQLVRAESRASRLLIAEEGPHVYVGDRPYYGPGVLHALPAHVPGFWYLDEVGTGWNSSLRFARFCPQEIDAEKAAYFFNGVSGHMLRENVSKTPQPPREADGLPPAAAVVFCQEIETQPRRAHFLTQEQIIRTCAERAGGERVYVKLHPAQSKPMRRHLMAICRDYANVELANCSVHDLIAASRLVVTQNSAAGFEALMHRKPVITCARSDFWHATLTPRTIADLQQALDWGEETMAGFSFEKYLYWFLDRNCLEPQKPAFASRAWARIRDKMFW